MKINYKSDFDAVLKLRDGRGKEIPFPDCDWEAIFWTFSKSRVFRASCIGGECVNCIRENDGSFRVIFNGHGIGAGVLRWEPHFMFPDSLFPDGVRDIYVPQPLDIELVTGAGDYPTTAEVEASLPLIKGDPGEPGADGKDGKDGANGKDGKDGAPGPAGPQGAPLTYADLTPEQIAELQRPAKDAALIARYNQAMTKYDGTSNSMSDSFGQYDPVSGLFMYGRIALITAEVRRMLDFRKTGVTSLLNAFSALWQLSAVAPICQASNAAVQTAYCFYMCRNLKVVAFNGYYQGDFQVAASTQCMFDGCVALEEILGVLNMASCNNTPRMFLNCRRLREVRLKNLQTAVSLSDSPLLSLESIRYMVENAGGSAAITITVHPTVYAKLTGDTTNAAAALTDEEAAAWQGLVTAAAAKNISFATV